MSKEKYSTHVIKFQRSKYTFFLKYYLSYSISHIPLHVFHFTVRISPSIHHSTPHISPSILHFKAGMSKEKYSMHVIKFQRSKYTLFSSTICRIPFHKLHFTARISPSILHFKVRISAVVFHSTYLASDTPFHNMYE